MTIRRPAIRVLTAAAALALMSLSFPANPPARSGTRLPVAATREDGMALIPGATFEMGTGPSEVERLQQTFGIRRAELFSAELPRHTVTVDSF